MFCEQKIRKLCKEINRKFRKEKKWKVRQPLIISLPFHIKTKSFPCAGFEPAYLQCQDPALQWVAFIFSANKETTKTHNALKEMAKHESLHWINNKCSNIDQCAAVSPGLSLTRKHGKLR